MSPSSGQRSFINNFEVCLILFWILTVSRLNEISFDIEDAKAFAEGMRHNTHLQELQYVPMMRVAHFEDVSLCVLRSGVESNDGCTAWKCKYSQAIDVSSMS